MAGPGGNNKPNPPKRNAKDNFFKRELREYRSSAPIDFMANKPPVARNRDCKSICKDIASGNINIQTEAGYFLNPALIDHLIQFTYSKWFYYKVIADSVEESYNTKRSMFGYQANDPRIISVIMENRKSEQAYRILYEGFEGIRGSGNAAGWLDVMISQLSAGRYGGNI